MISRVFELGGSRVVSGNDGELRKSMEYYGLSTDIKPIANAKNADIFFEMDKVDGKNRVFVFDEENHTWLEI